MDDDKFLQDMISTQRTIKKIICFALIAFSGFIICVLILLANYGLID